MRNFFKLIGIIALIAVIGFSMAACDDGNGGGGGGGSDLSVTINGLTPSTNYTVFFQEGYGTYDIADGASNASGTVTVSATRNSDNVIGYWGDDVLIGFRLKDDHSTDCVSKTTRKLQGTITLNYPADFE